MQRLSSLIWFFLPLFGMLFGCSDDDDLIVNRSILGEWQVVGILNTSPTGPILAPVEGETITITFTQSKSFSGTTSANSFSGRFRTSDDTLIFDGMASTDVAETVFGLAFFNAFYDADNSDTGLTSFQIAIQDESTLRLEYQEFRFLILQRP